ncbi:hypothetical protein YC2023_023757 [Brassica napus]
MEQLDTRAPVDCDDFLDLLHTKSMSHETQVLDPFSIHGLEPGVSDSDIKKAYRRLSIQYHPDKNPDPGRNAFLSSLSYFFPFNYYAKLWKFFTKAAEYMEIPVRRTDDEPLQKLFMSVRSELNLDLKNMKQEQVKFWKQHPAIVEAVPLSARKSSGVSSEGIAPFLWLPHFSDTVVKKIARKKVKSFQELQEISLADRSELLTQTESEEGIQEGDIVTLQAWVTLKRPNGIVGALPHAPYLPFHKEENYWVLLADSFSNNVWFSQKVSFMDEGGAITAASKTISDTGAGVKETSDAVREATEEVKSGAGTRGLVSNEGANAEEGMEVEEEEYDDYESEYSEDEDDKKDVDEKRGPKKANGTSYAGLFFKEERTNGTK